jgi:hypothetical protein
VLCEAVVAERLASASGRAASARPYAARGGTRQLHAAGVAVLQREDEDDRPAQRRESRRQTPMAANRGGDWGKKASDRWGPAGDDRGAGNGDGHDHARAGPTGATALGWRGGKRPKKGFSI